MANSKDCQGHKDKYLDTSRISNVHVQYESSSTHCSKVISKFNIFKEWVKLQGQGHRVQNNDTCNQQRSSHKEYSCELSKL